MKRLLSLAYIACCFVGPVVVGYPTCPRPEPRKVLVLTSGRSWSFRLHGVYSGRESLERARKSIQGTIGHWAHLEWNSPIEMTVDQIWEAPR